MSPRELLVVACAVVIAIALAEVLDLPYWAALVVALIVGLIATALLRSGAGKSE